jgi:hypothetical protein
MTVIMTITIKTIIIIEIIIVAIMIKSSTYEYSINNPFTVLVI